MPAAMKMLAAAAGWSVLGRSIAGVGGQYQGTTLCLGPFRLPDSFENFNDNVEVTFRDNAAVGSSLWMLAAWNVVLQDSVCFPS